MRITIQSSAMKDGVPVDNYTVDEPQVEVVADTPQGLVRAAGGPQPSPTRQTDPPPLNSVLHPG